MITAMSARSPCTEDEGCARIPDIAEARRMTSDELAAILPKGD